MRCPFDRTASWTTERPPVSRRFLLAVAVVLCCLGSFGPATRSAASAPEKDRPTFSVQVERVIATQRDLGRGRLWRGLTGRKESALFRRPYAVAWQGDDLLVTDPGAGQVLRIRPRGKILGSPQGLLQSPVGVAVCAEGIVVSDSILGKLALLDDRLQLKRWIAEGLERPTGVGCLGDRTFVAETRRHRVVALEPADPNGLAAPGTAWVEDHDGLVLAENRVVRTLGQRGEQAGEFNFPTAIGVGLGSLWVGDALNFRLQRLQPHSGEIQGAFGRLGDSAGEMPRLKAMAFDAGGRLWVSDAYLDQLALYRQDGTYLMSVGRTGSQPGEFSFPAGIAAHPDGRIAVVDSLNRRVQILRAAVVKNPE